MTDNNRKVYTAKDVQEILKCSKTQSYRIMNARIFPTFRIGRRTYVTVDDFEKFLKQAKHKTFKV